MAGEEEYEIMPHRTIENIKKELEELKLKAASKESISSESFRRSLDNLTTSLNSLMAIFKEATEEMKVEEETEDALKGKIGPLVEKVGEIESENRTIARSILALADMIKERMPGRKPEIEQEVIRRTWKEKLVPKPTISQMPPPPMHMKPSPKRPAMAHEERTVTRTVPPSMPLRERIAPFPEAPPRGLPPLEPMPPRMHEKEEPFFPPREEKLTPVPPPGMPAPSGAPSPLPPLPEMGPPAPEAPKKKGFLGKLLGK